MSIQAVAAVLDTDVGEVAAKMLLICIANAHNTTTGMCCPSIDRLCKESGMSRSSVKRWLRWLEERRFLRIIERHDSTGRSLAHAFELTLGEGASLNPSPQDLGEGANLTSRGFTGEPGEGFTVEPPLKEPEEKPYSPQPPMGGAGFAELWEVWDPDSRGNPANAQAAWRRLGHEERAAAVRLAPTVLTAYRRRKKARIPALARYLRDRVFEEFDGAPELDLDGHFIVRPGSPEWRAWIGWSRQKYGQRAVDHMVKVGYFLPETRWPEGRRPGVVA